MEQINTGARQKRIYRSEKWWQSVISREIKLASAGRCLLLCTSGRCCAPYCRFACCSHAITFHRAGVPAGSTVPPSLGSTSTAQLSAAPAPAPNHGPAVVPGRSLEGGGYEHMNHSLEKEELQAIKQGGKLKVFTLLCLLHLNF